MFQPRQFFDDAELEVGQFVKAVEDDARAKFLMYRWTP